MSYSARELINSSVEINKPVADSEDHMKHGYRQFLWNITGCKNAHQVNTLPTLDYFRLRAVKKNQVFNGPCSLTIDQTRTQCPSGHLFVPLSIGLYGKATNVRKAFWEGGRKSDNFLPSFPWCTANSLNPTHKPQRGQEKRLGTSMTIDNIFRLCDVTLDCVTAFLDCVMAFSGCVRPQRDNKEARRKRSAKKAKQVIKLKS